MIQFQTSDPRINDRWKVNEELIKEKTWRHLEPAELYSTGINSFLVLAKAGLRGQLEQCEVPVDISNNMNSKEKCYSTWFNYLTRTSALERCILQQQKDELNNCNNINQRGHQNNLANPKAVRIPTELMTDRYDFISKLKNYCVDSRNSTASGMIPYKMSDITLKGLQDDFYLNLVHWGKSGCIAAATGKKVKIIRRMDDMSEDFKECDQFIMGNGRAKLNTSDTGAPAGAAAGGGPEDGDIINNTSPPQDGILNSSGINASDESPSVGRSTRNQLDSITRNDNGSELSSLTWHPDGRVLTIGRKNGVIQAWDIEKRLCLRHIGSPQSHRIGAMHWSGSDNHSHDHDTPLLACGSRDKSVTVHDLRQKISIVEKWECHRQEVCGIKWNYHSPKLIASGGNDNKVYIWKMGYSKPLAALTSHVAAVKAIAWHPLNRNTLVTGGGTNDRQIRVWDVAQEQAIDHVDAEGQVCNIDWNKNGTKLLSSQGYSRNDLAVWNYPKLESRTTLRGHRSRVLYMSLCPDKKFAVTGSGDENIRIWNIFDDSDSIVNNKMTRSIFAP